MRRSELKKLVQIRLADARALLAARRYAGCYYLAGYAVECALKASIAKKFRANTIPDRKEVNDTYSHDFEKLVAVAGLESDLKEQRRNPTFDKKWGVVKDWKPDRRYDSDVKKNEALSLLDAIDDPDHGVLKWLSRHL